MAFQDSIQDKNQVYAIIGQSGTAGTAETRRIVVDENGAITTSFTAGTIAGGTISANLLPLSGVVLTTTVAVGTSATAIPSSPLTNRKSCFFYNVGTSSVAYGGSAVTYTTGIPVVIGDQSRSMDLGTTILYGAAQTTGGTVIILEIS